MGRILSATLGLALLAGLVSPQPASSQSATLIDAVPLVGTAAGIVPAPSGDKLFVANTNEWNSTLHVVDALNLSALRDIHVSAGTNWLCLSPNGQDLYSVGHLERGVARIDVESEVVLRTFHTSDMPYPAVADDHHLYVAGKYFTLETIDVESGARSSQGWAGVPMFKSISADGSVLYSGNYVGQVRAFGLPGLQGAPEISMPYPLDGRLPLAPPSGDLFVVVSTRDSTIFTYRKDGTGAAATHEPLRVVTLPNPPIASDHGWGDIDDSGRLLIVPCMSGMGGSIALVELSGPTLVAEFQWPYRIRTAVLAPGSEPNTAYFTDARGWIGKLALDWDLGPTPVTVDIQPGSDRNPINLHSKGVIPVAVLTTDSFDAVTVDVSTIRFGTGEAEETHGKAHLEDVDGDGRADLVLHFRAQDTGIEAGDISATLFGQTLSGEQIEGSDAIDTGKNRGGRKKPVNASITWGEVKSSVR